VDVLSQVITTVRFSSSAFLDARVSAPWCMTSQITPDDCQPYGETPRHIVAYHYVVKGELFLSLPGSDPIALRSGDIVLLPNNDRHTLGSAIGLTPEYVDDAIHPPRDNKPARLVIEGGGASCHIICGFLGSDLPENPLLTSLPSLMTLDTNARSYGQWFGDSFVRAAEEFSLGGMGSNIVLSKLAELLFVEAIRQYMAQIPDTQTGWLAGLTDSKVGKALTLLHNDPAYSWTAEELAHAVGASRSAFADRFTHLVGLPPMRYLAQWRLQLAALRLRETAHGIGKIALEVGYESETAFSRAFKKTFSTSPGQWRKNQ